MRTRLHTLDPRRLRAPRTHRTALALCLALAPPITPARAQSSPTRALTQKPAAPQRAEPQDEEVIRVNTNLVQVDVVVTDERGRQVSDLKATDFEIVEDGRSRAPEFFTYVSTGVAQSVANVAAQGQPTAQELRRTFAFVVANPIINVGFSNPGANGAPPTTGMYTTQTRALRAAEETHKLLSWFVDTQMTERDLAAVADTDVNIGVLASFTNDRAVLRAALDEVRANATNGRSPSVNLMSVGGEVELKPLMKQNLNALDTLANVIAQVERLPGRKIVALVARGILFNPRYPDADVVRARMEKLIERANRARIAVYTLSPNGLSDSRGAGFDGLIHLADATGGRAVYDSNDMRIGFSEIIEENRGYYLLAYNPGADTVARPHHIKVRVKRDGLHVRARSAAYAPASLANGSTESANSQTAAALDMPLAQREIKLTLAPSLVADGAGGSRISVKINADLSEVEASAKTAGAETLSLELFVRVAGPDGRTLRQEGRALSFSLKGPDFEAARREGLTTQFEIAADKPGFYRIGVALRDTVSGREGSATRFFKIENSKTRK